MAGQQECACPPRRKESVLTLDGGGIRGHATLLIIRHLMTLCLALEHRYDRDMLHHNGEVDKKLPLPCHYFDHIFGTSTGGIIAIMLGRLRMSIDDSIEVYERFGVEVFGRKRRFSWFRRNTYSAESVEAFMAGVVGKHCLDPERIEVAPTLLDPTIPGEGHDREVRESRRYVPCRVAVLTVRKAQNEELYMLRSYHNSTPPDVKKYLGKLLNLRSQSEVTIVQAARATSAAPTYFKPTTIDGSNFMDGGMDANNPSLLAWHEVDSMHGNNPSGKCPGATGGIRHIISIGTGIRTRVKVRDEPLRRGLSILERGVRQLTDPEPTHNHMASVMSSEIYSRFNIAKDLGDIKMDEFKSVPGHYVTLEGIEKLVGKYTREERALFEEVARRLVDHRRERCKPGWKTYKGLSQPGPLAEQFHDRFHCESSTPSFEDYQSNSPSQNNHHEMFNGLPRNNHHETSSNGLTGINLHERSNELPRTNHHEMSNGLSWNHHQEMSTGPPGANHHETSNRPSRANHQERSDELLRANHHELAHGLPWANRHEMPNELPWTNDHELPNGHAISPQGISELPSPHDLREPWSPVTFTQELSGRPLSLRTNVSPFTRSLPSSPYGSEHIPASPQAYHSANPEGESRASRLPFVYGREYLHPSSPQMGLTPT